MSERSLMGIPARTAYWVDWWRHFGPASGDEHKLQDPMGVASHARVDGAGAGHQPSPRGAVSRDPAITDTA